MHLLKNAYEQNLAQCIARAQSAWFLFIFLIPDPLSYGKRISPAGHSNAISNTMDQGSVSLWEWHLLISHTDPRT